MQNVHGGASKLEALAPGGAFRFYFRGEGAIGLKAQFPHIAVALALTSTNAFRSGALLSGFDVGDLIALAGAKIVPSIKPGTVAPGKGHFAQPGEIELHGDRLFFVTRRTPTAASSSGSICNPATLAARAAPCRLRFIPNGRFRMARKRYTSTRQRRPTLPGP